MARELAITTPDGKTNTIRLDGDRLSLGRSSANELCYPEDVGLSRQHMALERDGDNWTVSDLGSKNGTFVNGVRVSAKSKLKPGDRIMASRVVLVFEPSSADSDKTVIFDGLAAVSPSQVTVSTTLESLLKGTEPKGSSSPGATAQWESPVKALVRAGRELAFRRPLPELFRVILDLSIEAVGAHRGVLLTVEKGQLAVQSTRGEGFHISTTVRDRVLKAKNSLLVRDTAQDEALRARHSIVAQSVHTLMAVPLQTDNQVIGLIYVDSPQFAREFSGDDLNLLTVMANVAAIRIERERLADVEQAEKLMAAELEQAAEIQRQFLPAVAPVVPGIELAGYNAPCRTVGGDYYDFLAYPDGRVGLVIGDVAGKGMPAALLMTSLQAKVQAIAEAQEDPGKAIGRLNRSLAVTCPRNRFVTFFYSVVNPASGELAYCNAGHNPPYLLRSNGELEEVQGGGPPLGIFANMPYKQECVQLNKGDLLLLYSDGVTEACNPAGEEFQERLLQILKKMRGAPAAEVVETVHESVKDWLAGAAPADDVTVVAARRIG